MMFTSHWVRRRARSAATLPSVAVVLCVLWSNVASAEPRATATADANEKPEAAESSDSTQTAPVTASPEVGEDLDMSWDRGMARLSLFGSASRPDPDSDQRFTEATLDGRVSLPLYSHLHLDFRERDFYGLFLLAHLGAAGYTLDPQLAEGPDRYYRFSAGGSIGWLNSWPALLTLYAGARAAESESTLSEPKLRPLVLGLVMQRLFPGFALIYGAGFTYHLGQGFPLPFLGAAWDFAADWSVVTLLPASAYLQYQATGHWQFSAGASLDGDSFGYETTSTDSSAIYRTLGVARLKFLLRATYGAYKDPQLRFDLGVQGTRVDPDRRDDADDPTTYGGVFGRAMLLVPWGP